MMSSAKSQDGYSKILSKTDCEKLKSVNLRVKVDAAEPLVCI